MLARELTPDKGTVEHGATVKIGHLSQDTAEIPGHLRVLEAVEEVRGYARLGDGRELTAASLIERFGFRGERARTLVKDLSGGERRRLQLMRLLMGEPNVLLLDEPTNDLDIDTLTALEDLLDRWPGTLVIVSHDRYFVERVCDNVYALTGDAKVTHVPGGIEQYLALRKPAPPSGGARARGASRPEPGGRPRRPQGGSAPRARAREAHRAGSRAARADGGGRDRSRPPA